MKMNNFLVALFVSAFWSCSVARSVDNSLESSDAAINDDEVEEAVFDEAEADEESKDESNEDLILNPDLFEGDILGINVTEAATSRNAISAAGGSQWPAGTIPYIISSSFSSSEQSVIKKAMASYHTNTCIKFVPRTNQKDYISIVTGGGCSSFVGRQGGKQIVTLGRGCVYIGTVIHELLHAVGFWHEQSRPDRDSYVTIDWNNIQSGMAYNFQKNRNNEVHDLGVPYDLKSVMHYSSKAFSKNGKPTITVKNGKDSIGQRSGLSTLDIKQINLLYKCNKSKRAHQTPCSTTQ